MKTLSLKLKDDIFEEAERVVHSIGIARNAYINQALAFYNRLHRRKRLRGLLHQESRLVREGSLKTLELLEQIEDEIPG
jgi:hypothetical protein